MIFISVSTILFLAALFFLLFLNMNAIVFLPFLSKFFFLVISVSLLASANPDDYYSNENLYLFISSYL